MARKIRSISSNKTAAARFWNKVCKTKTCWNWIGNNVYGYGYFAPNGRAGKHIRANRFSWFLHYENDPGKRHVLHHCDNPKCVRPDHLFLGGDLENQRDRCLKGRHHNQVKTHCPHGHEYTSANTYVDYRGRRRCRICIGRVEGRRRGPSRRRDA
jgi:hypothetical protein